MEEHERALNSLAIYIKRNPNTTAGMQLRKFLWSMYDPQELINLMRFYCRLPQSLRNLVQIVNNATTRGFLQRSDLHREYQNKASDFFLSFVWTKGVRHRGSHSFSIFEGAALAIERRGKEQRL
jgi:hypothetical protein